MSDNKSVPFQIAGGRVVRTPVLALWRAVLLVVTLLVCGFAMRAQDQLPASTTERGGAHQTTLETTGSTSQQTPEQQQTGSISGTIVDRTGTAVAGARIKLSHEAQPATVETQSNEDGQFSLSNVKPGPFELTVSSEGFAAQTVSGNLGAGESYPPLQIVLALATNVTQVRVELTTIEIAQEQLKDQEKQRVFGVIPNFYVTYIPDAAPLSTKQKFQLAWKTSVDPVSFGLTGVVAGIEQAQNRFPGYGQGAEGYAKRYGATYADFTIGTFIGGAVLPSLLKQDPRYFYKGTGTKKSRVLYALANAVICKGDNGHWQANYSTILGSLAAGGISNLYYPASDRNGAALTFENALIGIGASAAANILQEFVIKKLTPNLPHSAPNTLATP